MSQTALDPFRLDAEREIERIGATMRHLVPEVLKRRGLVVGVSGGIDSAVSAALAVEGLGARRVFGLLMPERDSSSDSERLGRLLCETLGIEYAVEPVGDTLEAVGCYHRRDEAIRSVVPEFGAGWACKIGLPAVDPGVHTLSIFSLVVRSPEGETRTVRLPAAAYRQIVAATNFKQRIRKMLEYYHADRLHYAVVGTPNRLEYDQGFFVKGGDGLADIKPIAHLYKTEVHRLAEALGVPAEIRERPSTTDTYSLAQSQEEFYFRLPLPDMDRVLYAHNAGWSPSRTADAFGIEEERVANAFEDLERKRQTTLYLHLPALLVDEVPEVRRDEAH